MSVDRMVSAGQSEEVQVVCLRQQTRWRLCTVRRGEHHLPTGPKSSVAYGIKSDHEQKKQRGGGEIKISGVKSMQHFHSTFLSLVVS